MQERTFLLLDRSTLLHLRLPFSFFLLPVFCFALSASASLNVPNILVVFIVLHFFIYPGSNAYNSYMDEDKSSIGGLKDPPPVTKKLFYTSMIFDALGLMLCFAVNFKLFLLMLLYVLISKAYSWKKIRLKKYAITGWLTVALFQGAYTFLMVGMCAENDFGTEWLREKNTHAMLLASLLIGASYPLTQVYQHDEDSARGDLTISYKLGIRGTFAFTAFLFAAACAEAFFYFEAGNELYIFMLCLFPAILYFLFWFAKTWRNKEFADYDHAMRMISVSSAAMILCFVILLALRFYK